MDVICGIDVGSLRTPSYVAWLWDGQFLLDMYIPSTLEPLPPLPSGWPQPQYIAIDAPQGLAKVGQKRRVADVEAKTPTSVLPQNREELATWRIYQGLIAAGIEICWSVTEMHLASVFGLFEVSPDTPMIMETYPRYIIKRLWPELTIPSKRKAALGYVNAIWPRIQEMGYQCPSVLRPNVDQVDAMLCAIAASAFSSSTGKPAGTVGAQPYIDEESRILREGYIVSP